MDRRELPPCLIGLKACATSHFWAREIGALGYDVRLIPPAYAEAICEAVTRRNMRFVPEKSAERQGVLMLHRTRDLLMRQRTMMLNAVSGHLAEFGIITATAMAASIPDPAVFKTGRRYLGGAACW